jgi:hypothetical protein
MIKTNEGALAHEHSLDHHVEFFSKAGSLFTKGKKSKRQDYYANSESALSLFQKCWIVDREKAMRLLFWLRDPRGGAGNRSAFRECINWVATTQAPWVSENIKMIVENGRWDDLKSLVGTSCQAQAFDMWAEAIKGGDGLASKWVSRKKDIALRKHMKLSPKDFRKLLVKNTSVVENDMCKKNWNEIEYKKVPSKAMSLYSKAFNKNDETRFSSFKDKVEKGEETINASVLFPHDCVRTAKNGDKQAADLQFNALPNYLEGTNQRIMPICDTSGSMSSIVGGSITAYDVATSLALYCSQMVGKDNPFYKKFIQFCSESKLTDWSGMKMSEAIGNGGGYYDRGGIFDGAIGSTRIATALDMLLSMGKMFNASPEQMPNTLLILSDMQFHEGTSSYSGYGSSRSRSEEYTQPVVKQHLAKWKAAGFELPKVLYWNLQGYAGSPDTVDAKNVGLVSGFSPSILKAVFGGEDFTPLAIMEKAIEKYVVKVPA